MPELPEVEVTRLSFASRIAGARVEAVRMGKPLRWPLGVAPEHLVGQRVLVVRRRGKYLLLDLSEGLLLLHLGMSGSLAFASELPAAGVHDHFEMQTTLGVLRLHDPRRFGAVVFAQTQDAPEARKLLQHLGQEPLPQDGGPGFDAKAAALAFKARRAPIKQVLLAGAVVVGVGNIYASEALFEAGIAPMRRSSSLTKPQMARLLAAIESVLSRAVAAGGSTLRDFENAQGQTGYFQLQARVYGREGQPCSTCAQPVRRTVHAQRATYWCANCQK